MKAIDDKIWYNIKRRFIVIIVVLSFFLGFVFYKAVKIHFFESENYSGFAKKQYEGFVLINKTRGAIFDRNLKELATTVPYKTISVYPYLLESTKKKPENKEKALKILSKHLNISEQDLLKKLEGKTTFAYIQKLVPKDISEKLEKELNANNVEGVNFEAEVKREYPNGELASQIIGFTGGESIGLQGIEKYFDDELKFHGDKLNALKDAKRNVVEVKDFDFDNINGSYNQIVLTIDSFIQYFTEEELKKGVEENKAKRGLAIVMKADTGEILSMAQYPSFDLNNYKDVKDKSLYNPLATSLVYEPGSTFKVMTIAAAINEKVVTPQTSFDCENGKYKVGRFIIRDSHPNGVLTVEEILKKSSNIGALKAVTRLERDVFYKYVKDFNFGEKYNLTLPGQERGLVQPLKRWKTVEMSNIAFGQGIAVTPLQLTTAFTSVINGGNLMEPLLVKEIINEKKEVVKKFEPTVIRKVISQETSNLMKDMLEHVVSTQGTAVKASIPGVRVGGKTGTAQKVDSTRKTYSDKRISSFIGFFPIEKPEFVILVLIDEPSFSSYGGLVAAPVFREIAIKILNYYHKLPQDMEQIKLNIKSLTDKIESNLDIPNFRENFKLLQEVNKTGELDINIPVQEEDTATDIMPNVLNMDIRNAFSQFKSGLYNLEIDGTGIVTRTIPATGENIYKGQTVKIYLSQDEL